MPARTYLIVHGWQASGVGHWQSWLARRLQASNESVLYPLLPTPDNPIPHEWIQALHDQVSLMQGEKIVICHSLGGITWLHYALMPYAIPVDRLCWWRLPAGRPERTLDLEFAPVPLDPVAVARTAGQCRIVCSRGDEYCEVSAELAYAGPLGIATDLLPPRAGHINIAAGFGPWPQVEKWCYDPAIRFSEAP
jgi:predicted alpha/beta hydrolase family esterase